MLQAEERNLELTPRSIGTRDRRPNRTIQFELSDIVNRFTNNLSSIKAQFELAEQLKAESNIQYKDILRSQIVFLDSALDFFIHEVTKYGMVQIFQGTWEKTERYNNFTIRLGEISDVLRNPEQENWFLDIVNDSYAEDTFMSADAVIGQLNLIGVKWQSVADRAFYEQGSTTSTKDKFKYTLNTLFRRRNQIAHQADCLHETGVKIDIEREDVEKYIDDVEKIVIAISEEIEHVNNSR
ncbi:MAG: HEPN domain-containing protein [Blautia sp.]|nr:HEPN domain-containing protein [Lachnoclostridium sp.]MCM1212046.1 HEPN domain-containing protein [Blautia sp.]